ncbi:MAG: hypothetical protein ACI9N1_002320 [Flavobacteriales bacterium]|jgi:hypothetical protein
MKKTTPLILILSLLIASASCKKEEIPTDNSSSSTPPVTVVDQSTNLTFIADGQAVAFEDFSHGLDVDRASITAGTTDQSDGSTINSISIRFLDTISVGNHNFTFDTNSPAVIYYDVNEGWYLSDENLPANMTVTEHTVVDGTWMFIKGEYSCTLEHQSNGTTKVVSGTFQGKHWF